MLESMLGQFVTVAGMGIVTGGCLCGIAVSYTHLTLPTN